MEIDECLVAKILLMNVTKTNEHSNVTGFVHALVSRSCDNTNKLSPNKCDFDAVSNFPPPTILKQSQQLHYIITVL